MPQRAGTNILNHSERIFNGIVIQESMSELSHHKSANKERLGRRCFIGDFASPEVRWVDNAVCPDCGCDKLMDAGKMGLCISCNRFVKPKKKQ